jgi:hypothetical protein
MKQTKPGFAWSFAAYPCVMRTLRGNETVRLRLVALVMVATQTLATADEGNSWAPQVLAADGICSRVPFASTVTSCSDSATYLIEVGWWPQGAYSERKIYCYTERSVESWQLTKRPGYKGRRNVVYGRSPTYYLMVAQKRGYEAWTPFGRGSCVTLVRYASDLDALLVVTTSVWDGPCDEEKPLSVAPCEAAQPRWEFREP